MKFSEIKCGSSSEFNSYRKIDKRFATDPYWERFKNY
jgi:hypothetical protein